MTKKRKKLDYRANINKAKRLRNERKQNLDFEEIIISQNEQKETKGEFFIFNVDNNISYVDLTLI